MRKRDSHFFSFREVQTHEKGTPTCVDALKSDTIFVL